MKLRNQRCNHWVIHPMLIGLLFWVWSGHAFCGHDCHSCSPATIKSSNTILPTSRASTKITNILTKRYPMRNGRRRSVNQLEAIGRGGAMAASSSGSSSFFAIITRVRNHPIVQFIWKSMIAFTAILYEELKALSTIQRCLLAAMFFIGFWIGRSSSGVSFQAYTNAVDIPSRYFGPTAPYLKGQVLSVSDGDTFRLLHTPTPFHPKTVVPKDGKKKPKLSDSTLPIRICTIDTPETAKFGKSGQPFGQEAKEVLQELVLDKSVKVRLLQKDQYGRAVGQVVVPSGKGKGKGVDEVLLQAGLAEVYQGMGAVYGPLGKEKYLQYEEQARQEKKGIWSQSKRESAAEYKRRTK